MKKRSRKYLVGIIGILISLAAIFWIASNTDISTSFYQLADVDPIYAIGAMFAYSATFPLRGLRWKLMLRHHKRIPYSQFLNSIVVSFMGNNLLPARGGELVRMEYFKKKAGVPRITGLSSLLTEKIIDGLTLIGVLFLMIGIADEDLLAIGWMEQLTWVVTALFLSAFVGVIVLRVKGASLFRYFYRRSDKKFLSMIAGFIKKAYAALGFIKLDRNTLFIVLLCAVIWSFEGVVYILVLHALEVPTDLVVASFLSLTIVNFGILVPSSPAYIGVFQGMAILALSLFGVGKELALSVGLMVHVCQFFPVVLWGIGILFKDSFSILKNAQEIPEEER